MRFPNAAFIWRVFPDIASMVDPYQYYCGERFFVNIYSALEKRFSFHSTEPFKGTYFIWGALKLEDWIFCVKHLKSIY